jgi:hypothetical protein
VFSRLQDAEKWRQCDVVRPNIIGEVGEFSFNKSVEQKDEEVVTFVNNMILQDAEKNGASVMSSILNNILERREFSFN